MNFQLDPITVAKLDAFAHRRRRLIVLRGVAAGVLTLLVVMSLIAVVDRFVMMPDTVRAWLSVAGWATVLGVVWVTCGRMMARIPSERELARLVEKVQPALREDLISAVELGAPDADARFDSEVFRALLQSSVAERMRDVDVQRLLPRTLVAWWVRLAAAAVVVCLILLFMPGLQFGQMFVRAIVPGANLDRVSAITITVVEPAGGDAVAPQGDPVSVVIELSGPDAEQVTLHAYRDGASREDTAMKPVGPRRFAGVLQLGRDNVQYRVQADDALTRRYTLSPRPRPFVRQFEKTYRHPAYTRLDERQAVEDHGDITALEGTSVLLKLTADQPIASGELQFDHGGQRTSLPLTVENGTTLSARVDVAKTGTYRVHLVAAETQFDNKFSPDYEIDALPDLAPRVEIEQPTGNPSLPSDEIVALRGSAQDDLGLAKVEQHVRINDGPWKKVELAADAGLDFPVLRRWDLLELGVKVGDQITTKLVASDFKDPPNVSESNPLSITVSSLAFKPQRHDALMAKLRVFDSVTKLRDAARQARTSAHEAINEIRNSGNDELRRRQYVLAATRSAEQLAEQAGQTFDAVKSAMGAVAEPGGAHDLSLIGRVISRIRHEGAGQAATAMRRYADAQNDEERNAALNQAAERMDRAQHDGNGLADNYRQMLIEAEAVAIATDLLALRQEQRRIAPRDGDRLDDEVMRRQLVRREAVVLQQTEAIEQLLQQFLDRGDERDRDWLRRTIQRLEKSREGMAETLADEQARGESLGRRARDLIVRYDETLGEAINELRNRAHRARDARRNLAAHAGDDPQLVYELRQQFEQVANHRRQIADRLRNGEDSANLAQPIAEADRLHRRVDEQWQVAADRLKDRASIEESRRDADSQFVADAANVARALSQLKVAAADAQQAASVLETVTRLAAAYQTLDAGHDVVELDTTARGLATTERWAKPDHGFVTDHPRSWLFTGYRLEATPDRMRRARLIDEAVKLIEQARNCPEAQTVNNEMNHRLSDRNHLDAVPTPLQKVSDLIAEARRLIDPSLREARQTVAESAPSISELARGLAEQARENERQTQAAAEQARIDAQPQQTREQARELLDDQQQLNEQLQELTDALRRDANTQDVLTEAGRERARDADDAVAMVRQPADRAEQALSNAAAQQATADQQQQLSDAQQQQSDLAAALQQVAEHYENLDANDAQAVADSRQTLREAESELGIRRQLDAEYEQLRQLARLANLTPQEQLAELERQLQENRPMQRELSEIAEAALQQAQRQLERAAATEQRVERNLAEAEQQMRQQGETFAEQLRQIGEQAAQLANQNVPAAAQAAQQGRVPQADQPLNQARQALNDVGQQAQQAARAEAPVEELAQHAGELVQPLRNAAEDLNRAAQAAQQAARSPMIDANQAQAAANAAQQAAERADQAAQEAQQAAQAAADAAQHAANTPQAEQANQAMQQASQAAQRAQQAAQQSAQSAQQSRQSAEAARQANEPAQANQQSAQAVQQANQAAQQANQAAQAARQAAMAANQTAQLAQQAAPQSPDRAAAEQSAQQAGEESLQAARAAEQTGQAAQQAQTAAQQAQATAQSAQQARQQSQAASQQAQQLAERARQLAEALNNQQQQAANQLAEAAQRQQPIGQQVGEASQDVARAARHETRLGNEAMAQAIEQIADAAGEAAAQDVPQAAEQLRQADSPGEARPAVASAAEAIADPARALAELLNQAAQGEPASGQPASGQPESGEPASGEPGQPSQGQPSQGQPTQAQPGQGQPSQGQPPQAQPGQGQPSQGQPSRSQPSQGQPGQSPGSPSDSAAPIDSSAAEWLARALDQLDQSLFGQPATGSPSDPSSAQASQQPGQGQPSPGQGQPSQSQSPSAGAQQPGQPGQGQPGQGQPGQGQPGSQEALSAAAQAVQAAAAAQASSMASNRLAQSQQPSTDPIGQGQSQPGQGAAIVAGDLDYARLAEAVGLKKEEWGKLPPKLAKDLMQGSRENVSAEYRQMVEAYFRVIAERARNRSAK